MRYENPDSGVNHLVHYHDGYAYAFALGSDGALTRQMVSPDRWEVVERVDENAGYVDALALILKETTMTPETACYIIDNAEQMDLTHAQALELVDAGMIFNPVDDEPWYFTTHYEFDLDACERALKGLPLS